MLLPTGCPGSRVDVKLETDRIRVTVKGARARRPPITFALSFPSTNHVARRPPRRSLTPSYSPTATGEDVIRGELYAPIKAEASTWLIADGVLELSLLKRNRRGNYENGSNNAETFWFSVVREDGGRRDDAAGDAPSGYGRPAIGPPRVASSYPPNEYYEVRLVSFFAFRAPPPLGFNARRSIASVPLSTDPLRRPPERPRRRAGGRRARVQGAGELEPADDQEQAELGERDATRRDGDGRKRSMSG